MNPIEKETPSQDPVEPKAFYEKPMVTTFGTVAKLTMTGGTEALPDKTMSSRKRPS
jgi:hypothetical protein